MKSYKITKKGIDKVIINDYTIIKRSDIPTGNYRRYTDMKTVKVYGYFTTESGCTINSWLELPEDYSMYDVIRACQSKHFSHFMLIETMRRMTEVPNI